MWKGKLKPLQMTTPLPNWPFVIIGLLSKRRMGWTQLLTFLAKVMRQGPPLKDNSENLEVSIPSTVSINCHEAPFAVLISRYSTGNRRDRLFFSKVCDPVSI